MYLKRVIDDRTTNGGLEWGQRREGREAPRRVAAKRVFSLNAGVPLVTRSSFVKCSSATGVGGLPSGV